jgi:hypothetical protein
LAGFARRLDRNDSGPYCRRIGRALIEDLFVRSGPKGSTDLLSEQTSAAFYESVPHKAKPGYRI